MKTKKREKQSYVYRIGLFVFVCVLWMMPSGVTQAKGQAKVWKQDESKQEEADKDSDDSEEVRQYTLYLGQEFVWDDLPEGEFFFSEEGIAEFVEKNKIRTLRPGVTKLYYKDSDKTLEQDEADKEDEENENQLFAVIEVKENEKLKAVTFDSNSYSPLVLGTTVIQIKDPAWEGLSCRYDSENTAIASISNNGFVTPQAPGVTTIHVEVMDEYGGTYTYDVPIRVVKPKFTITKTNLAKGEVMVLPLTDHADSIIQALSSNENVVQVQAVSAFGVTVRAKGTGSAVITGLLHNVSFTCQVNVTNPKIAKPYGFYQKKKSFKIALTGLHADSVPQWKSENRTVATVDEKGKVKTKKLGSTVITCLVDGKTISYYLAVSTKTAVKAMRYGYKQVGKKKYSQSRRMSANYFDCSSFVYRSYRAAGKYLVCRSKWAPVAATIGKYYVQKGKRIKPSGKYYDLKKLRPGDLICWGGNGAKRNGRYKRIYHIGIYIGNGMTMESSSSCNNVVIRERGEFKKSQVPVVVRP